MKNNVDRSCDDAGEGTYVVNNVQHNCWADDKNATTDATAESAAELGTQEGYRLGGEPKQCDPVIRV